MTLAGEKVQNSPTEAPIKGRFSAERNSVSSAFEQSVYLYSFFFEMKYLIICLFAFFAITMARPQFGFGGFGGFGGQQQQQEQYGGGFPGYGGGFGQQQQQQDGYGGFGGQEQQQQQAGFGGFGGGFGQEQQQQGFGGYF
ncbi:34 kDa spicule matrix protein-like [Drosophila bipectinata]|uniref:34 kDa spicule matrix protein-like n=1 Tax=Drosophila bipectinata TaxID=42026 RepID=UPI001C8A606D|nr:heterogeneous nuclear ribonucleoprotein A1-like [Drosophila bipectinata]